VRLEGRFSLRLLRGGKSVYEEKTKNLITAAGENLCANRMLYSVAPAQPQWVSFGTGGTTADKSQTALIAEFGVARQTAASGMVVGNLLTLSWNYTPAIVMNAVVEIGVFNANAAGVMVSRSVIAAFNMGAVVGDVLAVTWQLQFLGA
jgi:hypothetical protein